MAINLTNKLNENIMMERIACIKKAKIYNDFNSSIIKLQF